MIVQPTALQTSKNRIGYTSLNLFWIVPKPQMINNVFKLDKSKAC